MSPILAANPLPNFLPLFAPQLEEMGKKAAAKGKQTATAKEVTAKGSKRAMELYRRRRGDIVFFPSDLDGEVLEAMY